MVDALRDASPLTLTFATSCFSPAARQLAFTTLRHMQVKRRLLRPVPPGLELSEELLELIAINLLRMQASAGMYARCSKAFKDAVTRAARLLELDENIIYWTGSSPPIKPLIEFSVLNGQSMHEWSAAFSSQDLFKFVKGSCLDDIKPLLESTWCTNFTLNLCLKGAGIADAIAIRDDGDVLAVARLLMSDVIDIARLAHVGISSFITKHPSWQAQLAAAPCVVHPLNTHNQHWATLRVWQHGPAELFESFEGGTDLKLVELVLELLSAYGWESGKRVDVYHFPHFQQADGHSCGIMTTAATISLLTDCQLGVCYSDLQAWKAFLAHSIYTTLTEFIPPIPRMRGNPLGWESE